MKILNGLFPNMVLCRGSKSSGSHKFSGACRDSGALRLWILAHSGKIIPGFDGITCGKAAGGRFSGIFSGLPAGGPYTIRLKAGNEEVTVKNVLVGDLWLLAGQSNMQGYGNLEDAYPSPDDNVRVYYMNDLWGRAQEPVCLPHIANASVHARLRALPQDPGWKDPLGKGTGPGVAFADILFKKTAIPQGLIMCAHGGTGMGQWSPGLKNRGDDSLYGAALNRARRNGGRVSGIVWYQGCNDTGRESSKVFERAMKHLIASFRRDLHSPSLPFIQAQLCRCTGLPDAANEGWSAVREIQRLLPRRLENVMTIPTIDLELDDTIHLSGKSQNILGRRFAQAAYTMLNGKNAQPLQISPGAITIKEVPRKGEKQLIVSFKNVAGQLVAGSRPAGFSFNRSTSDLSFRTELKGNQVILHLAQNVKVESIAYGYGANPYCNIIDEGGRSLPAFSFRNVRK